MTKQIRLEHLLSKVVHDPDGVRVGRIEEVKALRDNDTCLVTAYHVGRYALLERLSAAGILRAILHALPSHSGYVGYRVAWDEMDLSDPDHPRTTVSRAKLRKL